MQAQARSTGISLITLLWTDGGAKLPFDCCLSNEPSDRLNKNQHFRAMLQTAKERGFSPAYVAFDRWYSGLDNLKAIRSHGWQWLTRLKSNRTVAPNDTGNWQIHLLNIPDEGLVVHRRGYGLIKVFARVTPDREEAAFWATSDLSMTEIKRRQVADRVFAIARIPLRHQTMRRRGTVSDAKRASAAQSYSVGNPCVCPVGTAAFGNEPQLV